MQRYKGKKVTYLNSHSIRGTVWKDGRTWYYNVYDSEGKLVLTDNSGSHETILKEALLSVWAVRRIEIAGHYLEHSYSDILRYSLDEIPGPKRNRRKWIN